MRSEDLPRVLAWRNHADVRGYMLSQRVIEPDAHRQWFERCVQTGSRHLLIFEAAGEPLGFASFDSPEAGGISEWGFYAAPGAPKGTGTALGATAIQYGFKELKLYKICGRTLAGNERSIRLHLKLGFEREGTLKDQHFDGARYHDLICFGLRHRSL